MEEDSAKLCYCYRDVAMNTDVAGAGYIDPKYSAPIYKNSRKCFQNVHKLSVLSLPGNREPF